MSSEDVSVVRTELAGHEAELRMLLTDYFVEATEHGRVWFDDDDFGADIDDLVSGDLDRLDAAAIEQPLFLARADGRSVGTIQVKRLDETVAEVKRLYVKPAYRDAGVGAELVERLCTELRADGFETFRLGVAPYHERAQALYQSFGFEYRPPYEQTQCPEKRHDDWKFMEWTVAE